MQSIDKTKFGCFCRCARSWRFLWSLRETGGYSTGWWILYAGRVLLWQWRADTRWLDRRWLCSSWGNSCFWSQNCRCWKQKSQEFCKCYQSSHHPWKLTWIQATSFIRLLFGFFDWQSVFSIGWPMRNEANQHLFRWTNAAVLVSWPFWNQALCSCFDFVACWSCSGRDFAFENAHQ